MCHLGVVSTINIAGFTTKISNYKMYIHIIYNINSVKKGLFEITKLKYA